MFVYEMFYSSMKLLDRSSLLPSSFDSDIVETTFGTFRIRPHTVDMSNCSPAFERRDIDYLLNLIARLAGDRKRILFLDIGADIGTYSVTVGNRFKTDGKIHVMAFEPAPSSFSLLKENVSLNGLTEKTGLCNFALFSEDNKEIDFRFNTQAPGSSGVKFPRGDAISGQKVLARTLNAVLGDRIAEYDTFVFKIDVEGVEEEVLKGADGILGSGKEVFLVVEDFVNPKIIDFLRDIGAEFLCKLTPYNSWWRCRSGN